MELLIAYLVLGSLVAIAQRDWRLGSLVRATVLWPARVPAMLRGDPSPPDPPALAAWEDRIGASLASLEQAIEAGRMLANAEAGRKLLVDTRADLVAIARRHAELEQVLEAPENDLPSARTALVRADPHQRPVLQKRLAHIETLHSARAALETRLEAGMAEAMNLAARLHLARATDAPVSHLDESLADLARAVEGVEEAEGVGSGSVIDLPPTDWDAAPEPEPLPEVAAVDALRPTPVKEPASEEERRGFDAVFEETGVELPAVQAGSGPTDDRSAEGIPDADPAAHAARQARRVTIGATLALGAVSIFYRMLAAGGFEQTAALFMAMLPPAKTYTGTLLKATTLLLLLSGVILAEGLICILMAAPLFYMVAVIGGLLLDHVRLKSRATRALLIAPLGLLSLEGVHADLSAERAETVVVSRTVAGSPAEVEAALAARPDFDRTLPFALRMGFPRPVRSLGQGLEPGDRRLVHFAGGEGKPGDLVLEVSESTPGRVVFDAISDTSHIAHWMTWRSAEVTWAEVAPGRTDVTWTLRYDRELDPVFWFGPTERGAVALTAAYLLDCLLPPEVSDGDA